MGFGNERTNNTLFPQKYGRRRSFNVNKLSRKKKYLMLSRLPVKLKQNSGFVCEPSFTKVKRPDRVMIKTVVSVRQTAFLFHNIIVYVLISPDQKRRVPSRSIFKNSKLYVSMQHQSNRILICWYITIFAYLAFYAQLQLSGYLKKKKLKRNTKAVSRF